MKNNFDKIVDRRGTCCLKWDSVPPVKVDGEVLPLWVADMDFAAAPCIREAMQKRLDHGVFGYEEVPEGWYEAAIRWFASRHGWMMRREEILYTTGVVPGISAVIKAFTEPGDGVVVMTPVYNHFFSSIRNNGCEPICCPLAEASGPRYEIDFDALERGCADSRAKILLLCNPHNPAGRIWSREDLEKVAEMARRRSLLLISDEIHCEIVRPGRHYVPMATVDPSNCITLFSPSKSFNIAGLQMAGIWSDNPEWRRKVNRAININEICDVNPFAPVAGIAAYSDEGAAWLEELNAYFQDNYLMLKEKMAGKAPAFPVFELEATYLAWIDCRVLGMRSEDIEKELLKREKVWINAGEMYGVEGFIRVNMATSRALLSEGLDRMIRGLSALPGDGNVYKNSQKR